MTFAVIVEPVRTTGRKILTRAAGTKARRNRNHRGQSRVRWMKHHERARAHPTRDARRRRESVSRSSGARGRVSSSSQWVMTPRRVPRPRPLASRARAPWSLSAGRFVPWPPASASPPASIAHKKYPPIVSHRTESHRASRRRASSPFVIHRVSNESSESSSSRRRPTSASARTTVRDARVVFVALRSGRKKVIRQSAPSSNGLERRASVALDRSHAPIAIPRGPG